jgi:hypothetical protein
MREHLQIISQMEQVDGYLKMVTFLKVNTNKKRKRVMKKRK